MDGTYTRDSSYEINEYKPYMARAYTITLINRAELWEGILLSRYVSLRCGILSSLNSGLCLRYSRSVGMIIIVIVRWLVGMEHLNYACHP